MAFSRHCSFNGAGSGIPPHSSSLADSRIAWDLLTITQVLVPFTDVESASDLCFYSFESPQVTLCHQNCGPGFWKRMTAWCMLGDTEGCPLMQRAGFFNCWPDAGC